MPDDLPTIQPGVPFPGRIVSGPRVNALAMGKFHWHGLLMECTILQDGVFVWTSFDNRMLPSHAMEQLISVFRGLLGRLCQDMDKCAVDM